MARIGWEDSVPAPKVRESRPLPTFNFEFPPSQMQEGFYQWIYNSDGSAVLIAVAGSGKSTSIVHSILYIEPYKFVTVLAFNRIIAQEMQGKINEFGKKYGRDMKRTQARTFHSLGYGAICKYLNMRPSDINMDDRKLHRLFEEEFGLAKKEVYGSFVRKLVGLGKGVGIGVLVPNEHGTWADIISHHDLSLDVEESPEASEDEAIELAAKLLDISNEKAKAGWLDFDDQIYLPVLWKLKLWQNDYLFIDEAQDTNMIRRAIARMALKPGGRLIAVGDPCQAIYGFTGASHDALDLIKDQFNCIELPLTVSYRCPRVSEGMVKEHVPHYSVHEGAPEGEHISLNLKGALQRLTNTDAILCRNTAPLVELAFRIIGTGRACKVLGKDIGEGLINLIEKQRARDIEGLEEKLEIYRARETTKFMAKGEEAKAESINDRVASIKAVIQLLPEGRRTVSNLVDQLRSMFSDEGADGQPQRFLTLSTVHKAKGREWDTVAMLQPWLMPSKWARQAHQYKQELNLIYVARTRFKKTYITLIDEAPGR